MIIFFFGLIGCCKGAPSGLQFLSDPSITKAIVAEVGPRGPLVFVDRTDTQRKCNENLAVDAGPMRFPTVKREEDLVQIGFSSCNPTRTSTRNPIRSLLCNRLGLSPLLDYIKEGRGP